MKQVMKRSPASILRRPPMRRLARGKKMKAGFLSSLMKYGSAAYMGYKAPSILSSAKKTILNTLKKVPGVSSYANYMQQKGKADAFTKTSQQGKKEYEAIKTMPYNPYAPKDLQIAQNKDSLEFKQPNGQYFFGSKVNLADKPSDVLPMHKVDLNFAKDRGYKPPTVSNASSYFKISPNNPFAALLKSSQKTGTGKLKKRNMRTF